ncbi:type II toxin-antitoxin system Phd/YefM family antitoxin [Roseovarius sp.]|uniref:type II toxin-antitoxin system Phd/YefM family antitoxin n=1 Tax=Roseovarius sp. TaxID=1486281 RepID=UPI003A985DB7
MFITANTRKFREHFRSYLDHVMTTGERVLIYRHGKEVAALVCREDFNALEDAAGRNERLMEHRHQEAMERLRVMKARMRPG